MRTIFVADNLIEAQLLRQRLLSEGFDVVVRNAHLQGALGELPLSCRPEVCVVRDEDYAGARAVVDDVETRRRAPEGPECKCGHCGEMNPQGFELCWRCRSSIG